MKIGIMTYHNTRNCGAVLQAYALQRTLFNIGIDNRIIDYRCKKIEETYRLKHLWENKSVKSFIKWLITIGNNKKAQKKFDAFKFRNLELSNEYNASNIEDANKEFDCFITGSDQVWNFHLNGNDYAYLLDFADNDKKRISYAASMGSSIYQNTDEIRFKNELLKFSAVSVREKPMTGYIEKLTGISPELVLDPTLLLEKEDYDSLIVEKPVPYKYIFVYTIAPTPHIDKAARELSKQTGYPIIWGHMSYKKKKGVKNITDLSPEEFIRYIKYAEYVFTSSFHGMAFSIIMEKQFFYDLDVNKQNNNSRLETLSEMLDLQSRKLTKERSNRKIGPENVINYAHIEAKRKKLVKDSIEFLHKSIES